MNLKPLFLIDKGFKFISYLAGVLLSSIRNGLFDCHALTGVEDKVWTLYNAGYAVYCVKLVAYDRRVANKLRKGVDKASHKNYNTTPTEKEKSPNLTVRGCKFHSRSLNALVTHVRANIST